jgi:TfoX/Sxy family transcriptional regulator of competence genes
MATSKDFVEFVADLLSPLGDVQYRKMFGEYGIYANGVFFALACDDTLFFQCDEALLAKFPATGYPYPGAKLAGMADADLLEDHEKLLELAGESYRYKASIPPKKRKSPEKQ